jgi:hypothetical protein
MFAISHWHSMGFPTPRLRDDAAPLITRFRGNAY